MDTSFGSIMHVTNRKKTLLLVRDVRSILDVSFAGIKLIFVISFKMKMNHGETGNTPQLITCN